MLSANHELLSLGYGYFDTLLPNKDQEASFMSLETEYWRIIGLDTGYGAYNTFDWITAIDELSETDAPLQDEQMDWLNATLNLAEACKEDPRGIILTSHHQPFSDFVRDEAYPAAAKQLATLVPKDCSVLWLSGHEHEFSLYDLNENFDGVEMSVYHRLLGNGGFPQRPQQPSKHTALKAWDNRKYKTFQKNGGGEEDYVFNGCVLAGADLYHNFFR
jgi:hypothetical protein